MSERLRIAFYTDSFLPAIDGVVISILGFRKELERRGHEVYIFASGNERTRQMTKKDGRIIITRGVKFSKYPQYNLALFPFSTRLKTLNVRFDINHAHTPFMMGLHSMMMSKVERTPLVGSFHTLFTDRSVIKEYTTGNEAVSKAIIKYSWKYAKLFYNGCDGVAAPSAAIKEMLVRNGIGNVEVIPNGVDLKKFNTNISGAGIRKTLAGRDESLVMYVGRVSREKKLETMLKAAASIRDDKVKFAIVGTGPALEYYKGMAARLGLQGKLEFVGFVENDRLPEYYAACDAFCIPSTFETQGVVCLEAMASGKPVVGADYLAIKELVRNGANGELFRPNDSGECARKIRKVLYNIDSYKDMRSTARRYSIQNATDDLIGLYRRILNNN